jgi:TRAP-type C4-dicarboxylate transport system permease small subunit
MDELTPSAPHRRGPLFYVGSVGLLAAMLVEAAAVIGRHTGVPVTGALEIVQAAIVPAACASMLIATLRGTHAAVHMLTDRMSGVARRRVLCVGYLLAAAWSAALCAGSAWLATELWNSFEQTEVLHIPFRPLRMLVTLAAGALAVAFFRQALRAEKSS